MIQNRQVRTFSIQNFVEIQSKPTDFIYFCNLFHEAEKVERIQICQYMIYLLGTLFNYVTIPDIGKCVNTFICISLFTDNT